MSEPYRIHIEALNLRLKGYDQAAVVALARDLPAALARRLGGSTTSPPRTLAEAAAAEVASQIRGHMNGEG